MIDINQSLIDLNQSVIEISQSVIEISQSENIQLRSVKNANSQHAIIINWQIM